MREFSIAYAKVHENDSGSAELVRGKLCNGGIFELDKFVKKFLIFPMLGARPIKRVDE